jgi:hypothetical protein
MFLERAGKAGLESGAETLAKAGLLAADKYGLQAAEKHAGKHSNELGTYVLLGLSLLSLATVAGFGLVAKQLRSPNTHQHPAQGACPSVPEQPASRLLLTCKHNILFPSLLVLQQRAKGRKSPAPKGGQQRG